MDSLAVNSRRLTLSADERRKLVYWEIMTNAAEGFKQGGQSVRLVWAAFAICPTL